MGLPEQSRPGLITQPFHGRLQPQDQHPTPGDGTRQQPLPDQTAAQQGDVADQHHKPQQQCEAEVCGCKAVAEADEYRHEDSARHPCAVLGMLEGNRVCNRVELQSPFSRQDSEPDRRSRHGVDEQDDQYWMDQPPPMVRAEILQSLCFSHKTTQPSHQGCALADLEASKRIRPLLRCTRLPRGTAPWDRSAWWMDVDVTLKSSVCNGFQGVNHCPAPISESFRRVLVVIEIKTQVILFPDIPIKERF